MNAIKLRLRETGYFSPLFLDYIEGHPRLEPFYETQPTLNDFGGRIEKRTLSDEARETLTRSLRDQYGAGNLFPAVKAHIDRLSEHNTYTVTTGHQLNIFSGPLYFHYKISTTINLARELKKQYPKCHFVPVYWMASEDHDFEEINHFHLFGKKYTWATDQKGAVGRFNPKSMGPLFEQMPEKPELFTKAYLEHDTLAEATRYFVDQLYGQQGLIVLDADRAELKAGFRSVMEDDLLNHNAYKITEKTTAKLSALGYKPQIYPREINLFYLADQLRERIVRENDTFSVQNKDLSFSETEMISLLRTHPERFSPNVLLRPVYQETILPNLAYIGGPAEMAYWLQLKSVFGHYDVDFPMLIPRNFALILEKPAKKRLNKLGLSPEALFLDRKAIRELYLKKNSDLSFDTTDEKETVIEAFGGIKSKAKAIDPSLEGYIGAELTKTLKSMEHIQKRLKKAAEKREETGLRQLDQLLDRVFPGGNLQERTVNFMNFWLNDPEILHKLRETMKPLDFRFHILLDDE